MMKDRFRIGPALVALALIFFFIAQSRGQNVVDRAPLRDVLPAEMLPPDFAEELIAQPEPREFVAPNDATRRIAAKLDAHLRELMDGWPWRPLHHVLGISGFETYFDHPEELFHSLTLAHDCLPPESQKRLAQFLAERFAESPPFALDGFDRSAGQPRESFRVPESLRAKGRGRAQSVFGVAAFARYVAQVDGKAIDLAVHWKNIRSRIAPLLIEGAQVTSRRSDQAELLNGNLAGLIGAARLAQKVDDRETLRALLPRIQRLAQERADLERTNPHFVEKSSSGSKQLHHFKLARYVALTPENARVLRGSTRALAARQLRTFREMRPGWHVALGERLIGGENYTNPLHFDRALFAGAALIEELPTDQLLRWIDVPACKADLYFIEKCALALRGVEH